MNGQIVQSIDHAVNVMINGIAFFYRYSAQICAAGEGTVAQRRHTGRNGNLRQATALEREVTNGAQAGRQRNGVQHLTIFEGTFTNKVQRGVFCKFDAE